MNGSLPNRLRSIPGTLGVVASLITIAGVGFAAFKLMSPDHSTSATVEAKEIVGFHQLTNRICTENRRALQRAISEANSKVQLLAFLVRGTGWGVNDLESVTAPPGLADDFAEEMGIRRHMQAALLEMQQAGEAGDLEAKSDAAASIAGGEETAIDVDHKLGLRECAPVLPVKVRRAIGVG